MLYLLYIWEKELKGEIMWKVIDFFYISIVQATL